MPPLTQNDKATAPSADQRSTTGQPALLGEKVARVRPQPDVAPRRVGQLARNLPMSSERMDDIIKAHQAREKDND